MSRSKKQAAVDKAIVMTTVDIARRERYVKELRKKADCINKRIADEKETVELLMMNKKVLEDR